MTASTTTQNGAQPRGGVKRPPMGVVGRCSCYKHERVFGSTVRDNNQ